MLVRELITSQDNFTSGIVALMMVLGGNSLHI